MKTDKQFSRKMHLRIPSLMNLDFNLDLVKVILSICFIIVHIAYLT